MIEHVVRGFRKVYDDKGKLILKVPVSEKKVVEAVIEEPKLFDDEA